MFYKVFDFNQTYKLPVYVTYSSICTGEDFIILQLVCYPCLVFLDNKRLVVCVTINRFNTSLVPDTINTFDTSVVPDTINTFNISVVPELLFFL